MWDEYSNIFGYSNIVLRISNIRIRILSFDQINIFKYSIRKFEMSEYIRIFHVKFNFNKILKERMKIAAFSYLKNQQSKQEKIKEINYSKLEIQEYLLHGDRNPKVSQLIYQARGKILDIKMHKKWKFNDKLCIGCKTKEESGQEILDCKDLGGNNGNLTFNMVFSDIVREQLAVGNNLKNNLKVRERLREEVT